MTQSLQNNDDDKTHHLFYWILVQFLLTSEWKIHHLPSMSHDPVTLEMVSQHWKFLLDFGVFCFS